MLKYNILHDAAKYAHDYLNRLENRRVFPSEPSIQQLKNLTSSLPLLGKGDEQVLKDLHTIGSENTVATNGARYFGFVFGGTLPASLGANWLTTAWDQNAVFKVSSPVVAHLEKIAGDWLLQLLQLPGSSAVGFVTGTTMANFSGVIAARYQLTKKMGWDIKSKGLNQAPRIRVIVGEEVHASMQRALLLAGFGLDNLIRVPTDEQGRIIPDNFPVLDESTLVCLQAGNVNTGAFDPVEAICKKMKRQNVWVHVDAAFGLWAAASAEKKYLVRGIELADSWATDAHKWLNAPYDCGVVFVRDREALFAAMSANAAYIPADATREPFQYVPEMSRQSRAIPVWAALKSLGTTGLAALIDRNCHQAALFAEGLKGAGFTVLNDVVLNQVLVSFGEATITQQVIKLVQEEGVCWCGGTVWQGKTAMRISVSNWSTTDDDVRQSLTSIIKHAKNIAVNG